MWGGSGFVFNLRPFLGAAIGAGLGYGFVERNLVSLAAGAAAGFYLYPPAQEKVSTLGLPYPEYIFPVASGAAVAYGLFGQDYAMIAAGGAAGAVADHMLSAV